MTEWAQDIVRDAYAVFADLGLSAYAATYTPPGGGASVPCTVVVDRAVQTVGEFGTYVGPRTEIVLQVREVVAPAQGGGVAFGAESWKLDKLVSQDEAESRWVVRRG